MGAHILHQTLGAYAHGPGHKVKAGTSPEQEFWNANNRRRHDDVVTSGSVMDQPFRP